MSHFMKICAGTKFLDPLELVDDDFNGRMLMMAFSSKFRHLTAINFGQFYSDFLKFLKESDLYYTTYAVLKEGDKTSVWFYPKNITRTMDHIEIDRSGNASYHCTTSQSMYFFMETKKRNVVADLDRNFGSLAKNIICGHLKVVTESYDEMSITFNFKTSDEDLTISQTFTLAREYLNKYFLEDDACLAKKYPEMYQLFSG